MGVRPFACLIIFGFVGPLLVACTGSSTHDAPDRASAAIGGNGGVVSLTASGSPLTGARLEVPPGALQSSTHISITSAYGTARYQAGPDVVLKPDGLTFAKPVRLVLPYESGSDGTPQGADSPPQFLSIWQFDPQRQVWSRLETTVDPTTRTASALISHFSLYRLMVGKFASDTTVTYSFVSLPKNIAPGYSDDDLKNAIRRAFDTWSSLTAEVGVRFEEVAGTTADIQFYASPLGVTTNCSANVSDPRRLLLPARCHLDWLAGINADKVRIEFEDSSQWQWGAPTVATPSASFDMQSAALHEIGHALGLIHPNETCTQPPLMCTNPREEAGKYVPMRSLSGGDVDAFEGLYHASTYLQNHQRAAPAATPQSSPTVSQPTPTTPAQSTPSQPASVAVCHDGGTKPPCAMGVGTFVEVYGTGDCLRVRQAPSTGSAAVGCRVDGFIEQIDDGPVEADGYRWWRLRTQGWVAESWIRPARLVMADQEPRYRVEHRDVYLSNWVNRDPTGLSCLKAPRDVPGASVRCRFVAGASNGAGHFAFDVNAPSGHERFTDWLHGLGLTDEQIASLDIAYE